MEINSINLRIETLRLLVVTPPERGAAPYIGVVERGRDWPYLVLFPGSRERDGRLARAAAAAFNAVMDEAAQADEPTQCYKFLLWIEADTPAAREKYAAILKLPKEPA